jgi:hypothetical protein
MGLPLSTLAAVHQVRPQVLTPAPAGLPKDALLRPEVVDDDFEKLSTASPEYALGEGRILKNSII